MSNDANACSDDVPEHTIVWIDLNIGRPENYQVLKAAFSSTADPIHAQPVPLLSKDDTEIDRIRNFEPVYFEGVRFLLAAFSNVERCVDFLCLPQNEHRKIFMITSGDIGRAIIPVIMHRCAHVFTNPNTGEPYQSIYVFCHNIERNMDWMFRYMKYLATAFTFDKDVLVRMILDIAAYFVAEGKRLTTMEPPNSARAYNRFTWAHTLYRRYETLEGIRLLEKFAELNPLLEELEEAKRRANEDD